MLSLIRKRLELKITLSLALVIACAVVVSASVDTLLVREDMLRTSERTLGAFAAAMKGAVKASMLNGRHGTVRSLLDEISSPAFVDRLIIYNEQGRPLHGRETLYAQDALDIAIPPSILQTIGEGDRSEIQETKGKHFISYYAGLVNGPECHRCHGSQARLNGVLRIDFSLHELADLLAARRRRIVAWSGGLIVILVTVLSLLLRRVVHRPVRELREAMAGAAEGKGLGGLSMEGEDELGELKRSFASMFDRVSTLHQANLDNEVHLAHSQEMARFRAELHAMFDAMPDGVLMVDPERRIVQSNRRVHELLPHLKDADGVIPVPGVGPGEDPHRGMRRAFAEQRMTEQQTSLALPDGRIAHLHSICAPVFEDGKIAYVVEVIRDITDRINTERELEEMTAALRGTNRLLAHMAVTDSLTQLFNRRHFDEILSKEIKRYHRRKYDSLSLMMIDIDHFKKLNDRYGHLSGDTVLRELARILTEEVRETDTVARYGGEEFLIIMPDTPIEGAGHKADSIRKKVQMTEFTGQEGPINITISIGVAEYANGFPHDLVNAADKALYQAKNGGRNTVVVRRRDEVEV
jgi:diguanylate cyclase (GGDEF)-like protein/PAS domain S-box-containing protein